MKTVISVNFDRVQTRKQKDGSYDSNIANVTYLKETLQFKEGIKTKHAVNRSLDYSEGMLKDMFTSLYDSGKSIPSKIYVVIETSTGLTFNTHAKAKMLLDNGNLIAKSAFTINLSAADKKGKTDKAGKVIQQPLDAVALAAKYVAHFRSNVKFINGFAALRSNAAMSFDANSKAQNNVSLQPVTVAANGTLSEVKESEAVNA